MRELVTRTAAGAALAAALIMPVATTATAAAGPITAAQRPSDVADSFNDDGVRIHSGPGTGYSVNGLGYRGHSVTKHCFVGYDDQWTYITDNTTGVSGYVTPIYLDNGDLDIGMC
ncbi:hypothetical protein ACFY1U_28780 [Streptomyces sp. NPDC001351]|uniref:hypothetical protein n=1 Tax=Streptomyces sp. NPDC001351 TaxID=3364564 RepID=UPI0036B0D3F0